jgi:hypothetical protein
MCAVVGAACFVAPGGAEAQSYETLSADVREFVTVPESHVLIRGVRIIDGTGAPARDGMSVELLDGRIVSVGSTS